MIGVCRWLQIQRVTFRAKIVEQEAFDKQHGSKVGSISEQEMTLVGGVMPGEIDATFREKRSHATPVMQEEPCPA